MNEVQYCMEDKPYTWLLIVIIIRHQTVIVHDTLLSFCQVAKSKSKHPQRVECKNMDFHSLESQIKMHNQRSRGDNIWQEKSGMVTFQKCMYWGDSVVVIFLKHGLTACWHWIPVTISKTFNLSTSTPAPFRLYLAHDKSSKTMC